MLNYNSAQTDINIIVKHVQAAPKAIETDVQQLSQYLIQPATNDLEKVLSIYLWIINNISYDLKAYKNGNRRINRSNEDILAREKAICWGYATLVQGLCAKVGIPSEIISGYGKTSWTTLPNLDSPNHAWNSVKIDGVWYLLDATWDSGAIGNLHTFKEKFGEDYFMTSPKYFVVNHLPADPDWQLLDCPISIDEYLLSPEKIVNLAEREDCGRNDQKDNVESLPIHDKRFLTAQKAYEFNPTEANRRELAHAHVDYAEYLAEIADQLKAAEKFDSLLLVQGEMISLCEAASNMTKLFDTQKENCAYNLFNYAITLTQVMPEQNTSHLQKWERVRNYFQKAQIQLKALPQNMFTKRALDLCVDYIEYAEQNIAALK